MRHSYRTCKCELASFGVSVAPGIRRSTGAGVAPRRPSSIPYTWRSANYGELPEIGVAVLPRIPQAHGMYATQAPVPGTEAPLSGSEAVLVGLAALAVVFLPFLWPLVEQFNVMAHEGAHAVVGSIMGFGIKSVKLDIESRGETAYVNAPETGPRRTLTRFVGYLGSSGFGYARRNSSRPGTLSPCYGSQSCSWYCCCS